LAVSLTEAGHDAVHVADLRLSRASDLEILEVADRDERVVVSADTDFGTLLAMGNRRRPSVLLLRRASRRRTEQLAALLQSNLRAVADALGADRSWWSKTPASVFVPYPRTDGSRDARLRRVFNSWCLRVPAAHQDNAKS
jgi:predicted nuclease of predicted toxin-antitoxin system